MAESVIDIVHRISYEVTGQAQIQAITNRFNENVQSIGRNVASLTKLQAALNATTDPARQARLQQAIQNRTKAINEQGQAITKAIENDKQFQRTLQQEIGIINEMNGRLKALRDGRDRATSPESIKRYSDQIKQVEKEQKKLTGGQSLLGNFGNSLLQGIGIGSGIEIFQQAIGKIKELVSESMTFASEIEGVRIAFDRINRPTLLDDLRVATKGTVSDLELMKKAVQYNNLGLPINRLGTALEFARRRAKETGVDVNYLIQSLVDGIGRQSILKVDNLGISMKAVRQEVGRTGDFATALFNIIEKGLKDAGPEIETFAESQAKITATIENNQAKFGEYFNFIKSGFQSLLMDLPALFSNGPLVNTGLLLASTEGKIEEERIAAQRLAAINAGYLKSFGQFLTNVESLDINSRNERLKQAEAFYNKDLERAKVYYGSALGAYDLYAEFQKERYNRLISEITSKPLNVSTITAGNITSATKVQLEKALSTLEGQKNDLPFGEDVIAINKRISIIKAQLKKFDDDASKEAESLAEKLKKTLSDLAKRRAEILSKTGHETSESIRTQIEAARDAELEKIDIDEQSAIRKAEQTNITEALFADIRQKIKDNADLEYLKRNEDFLDKLLKQQNEFDLTIAKLELDQAKDAASLPEGNTIESRIDIVSKARTVELKENKKRFDDLAKQAKDIGESTEQIENDRQEAVLTIIEQSHRRAIELERAFLKERTDLINEDAQRTNVQNQADLIPDRETSIVPGNSPETERRLAILNAKSGLTTNRINQDATFEKLDVAKKNFERIKNYAGSTQQDIDIAANEVNELLISLQKLREESLKANADLDKLLTGRKLDKSGKEMEFTGGIKENIQDTITLYKSLEETAVSVINNILEAQIKAFDREIAYRQTTVEKAKELALRGNTEVLKAEEEQLAKATAARDAAAQRQLELNALLQASNMAVALSEAIGAIVAAAAKGDPYTIAARVIAAVAALVGGVAALSSAFSSSSQGFYTGGFTGNGGKMEPAGTVHKGEFVFNKETTTRHRELFEAIHKGGNPAIAMAKYPTYIPIMPKSVNGKNEIGSLRKELKEIKEAVLMSGIEVNAHQNLDAQGLNQTVETIKRKDKHRFKR